MSHRGTVCVEMARGIRVEVAERNAWGSEDEVECSEGEADHTNVNIIHSCRYRGVHDEASDTAVDENYGALVVVDAVVYRKTALD